MSARIVEPTDLLRELITLRRKFQDVYRQFAVLHNRTELITRGDNTRSLWLMGPDRKAKLGLGRVGGEDVLQWDENADGKHLWNAGRILAGSGVSASQAAPMFSFWNDTSSGLYLFSEGIRLSYGGLWRLSLEGTVAAFRNSVRTPAVQFGTSDATRLVRFSNGALGAYSNDNFVGQFHNNSLWVGTSATAGTDITQGNSLGTVLQGSAHYAAICRQGTMLYLNRANTTGDIAVFRSGGTTRAGRVRITHSNAVSYDDTSDYRLKTDVEGMTGALERLSRLRPVLFTWKDNGIREEGFIAHEVAEVIPQAVTGEKDAVDEDGNIDPQGVDPRRLIPTLVSAVQELAQEQQHQSELVAELTTENKELREENADLRARLERVEARLARVEAALGV